MNPDTSRDASTSKSRHILQWFLKYFRWPLLFAIPLIALIVAALSSQDFQGWGAEYVLKNKLEIAHPGLLFAFTLVTLAGWLLRGHRISGWMSLLGAAFFMREIHFEGSDYLMVVIVLGIFVYVWRNPDRFSALWKAHWPLSLLAMCFISYACSEVLFDRGLIKQPFEIIFDDPEWMLPYSSNIEESLETLGGLFLLLSGVLFVFRPSTDS
jgi:hypothetical protein